MDTICCTTFIRFSSPTFVYPIFIPQMRYIGPTIMCVLSLDYINKTQENIGNSHKWVFPSFKTVGRTPCADPQYINIYYRTYPKETTNMQG